MPRSRGHALQSKHSFPALIKSKGNIGLAAPIPSLGVGLGVESSLYTFH